VVKTLQVRQQGRLRELHRLWCWPPAFLPWPRSTWISAMHSHARTSAKIDATLFYVAAFFVLFLSPETARRSSQKNKKSSETKELTLLSRQVRHGTSPSDGGL
jgi:hypothetical protein